MAKANFLVTPKSNHEPLNDFKRKNIIPVYIRQILFGRFEKCEHISKLYLMLKKTINKCHYKLTSDSVVSCLTKE